MSFQDLNRRSLQFAHYLRDEAGLVAGDHIAVCASDGPDLVIVHWAAYKAGLSCTQVGTGLTVGAAVDIVKNCGARVVICSIEAADLANALVERTPLVRSRLVFGGELANHEPLDKVIARQALRPLDAPDISPREVEELPHDGGRTLLHREFDTVVTRWAARNRGRRGPWR